MRRLVLLVSAVVLVDSMLHAALTPLLPEYVERFGLSKSGAGLLVSAYAVGILGAALPAGLLAAKLGPKVGVLAGLTLTALSSFGYGLADDAWSLGAARLAQGAGSALSWAGALAWLVGATPRDRRGEMLGTALGAAVFGALLGPALGAAASIVGAGIIFSSVAVLFAGLALVALRMPAAPVERPSLPALRRLAREAAFLRALWLVTLPALLFGLVSILAPLELAALGWGALAIGGVFVASAALEGAFAPAVGRLADRRGTLLPVRLTLVAAVGVSLGFAWAGRAPLVAALVLAAGLAYGGLLAPGMTLISTVAERGGLAQAIAFGVMNAAWALGNALGPAAGGALAAASGDTLPYLLAAAACVATLTLVSATARGT